MANDTTLVSFVKTKNNFFSNSLKHVWGEFFRRTNKQRKTANTKSGGIARSGFTAKQTK
jgi:hypothetical protein